MPAGNSPESASHDLANPIVLPVPRLYVDAVPQEESVLQTVLRGLADHPKWLPSKLFYDEAGSELFEQICELDAYYPTRTERSIMHEYRSEIARAIGPRALLIEYGSGSSTKTVDLLQALENPSGYVPIDISREHLLASAARIASRFPTLEVLPVAADYASIIPEVHALCRNRHGTVYFPGSTIGNFEPEHAVAFLKRVRQLVGSGGGLLIGVDRIKHPNVLHLAYNDPEGVTAAFNRNMLRHVNRLLGPVFDPDRFDHVAFYNEPEHRIEMHLAARSAHQIRIDGRAIPIEAGERIRTEWSYKYHPTDFEELLAKGGFELTGHWTDARAWFSVFYAVSADG